MAELPSGGEPVEGLVDVILEAGKPHVGAHIKARCRLRGCSGCRNSGGSTGGGGLSANAAEAERSGGVHTPQPTPPSLHVQAPEAVANKAIKAAAAKLEREEMAASPTHSMKKRDEGGLASAVQV